MLDLSHIKENFSSMVMEAQPWTLTQFVMWLDLKLSEYKIKGYMVLDNEKVTKPKWLSSDDDSDRSGNIVPPPPSCRNCNGQQQQQSGNFGRQRDSSDPFRQRGIKRTRRQNESYIQEVLGVSESGAQSSRTSFDSRGNKSYHPKVNVGPVISLEPATDLTAEDIQEMDEVLQVQSSGSKSHRSGDIEITSIRNVDGPSPRTQHQVHGSHSAVSSSGDRSFITSSHDGQSSENSRSSIQSSSFSGRAQREASPPKRQIAMVDLSQTMIAPPSDDSSFGQHSSGRQDISTVSKSENTGTGSAYNQSSSSDTKDRSATESKEIVPVALHVVNQPSSATMSQDPGGGEASSSFSAADIKQEAESEASFDDSSFYMGDESESQMYMVGDNSLSDSEANFQSMSYSPTQGTQGQSLQMPLGPALFPPGVGGEEIELPKFEDPLVRRVLEDGVTPSRHMWSKIITRCAYHMLSKGVPHKHDYQLFSRAFYMKYPCVGTNRGPNPWEFFRRSVQKSIYNIRHYSKKKQQKYQQE